MKRFIPVLFLISMTGCSGSNDNEVENINKALTTMLKFEDALGKYRVDASAYPASSEGLSALVKKPESASVWKGPYLEGDLPFDPWGNPYIYEHGAGIYRIVSAGPDGDLGSADDLETKTKIEEDEAVEG